MSTLGEQSLAGLSGSLPDQKRLGPAGAGQSGEKHGAGSFCYPSRPARDSERLRQTVGEFSCAPESEFYPGLCSRVYAFLQQIFTQH